MKHVVSFSGGRTSAYLAYLIKNKIEDADFIFCDTGAEDPRTYDFIRQVNSEFKLNLTCLRAVFSQEEGVGVSYKVVGLDDIKPDLEPFTGLVSKHGVPYYPMGRQCTYLMKTEPFEKYCKDKYGSGNYNKWLGMRADEPRRLKPKKGVSYLADISDFERPDVLAWWEKQSFDLKTPEWLNNCMFCIQKKVSKIALASMDMPEHSDNFINMVESSARHKEGKVYDAMYEHGYSLKKIRKMWEDTPREAVMQSVVRGKRFETGSCSESCEPFQDEMFSLEYK